MELSLAGRRKAQEFITGHARPLEQALYAFHFESGSPSAVIQELAAFRSNDGGYGHGLEPDKDLPDSSAIGTVRALQILTEIGVGIDEPLVQHGVRWLLDTYDATTATWEIVPRAVNDAPHAPWWHYDDEGQAAKWGNYLVNPRAEIVGCLVSYSALVPADFLGHITKIMLAHIAGQTELTNMHDIACYLALLDSRGIRPEFRSAIEAHVMPAITRCVERNPANWAGYCLRPTGYMGVVKSPTSPFANEFAAEISLSLDYDIQHQAEDGSWAPTWSWGESYPEAWERAKVAWQGILTVNMLKTLAAFGRL